MDVGYKDPVVLIYQRNREIHPETA